MAIPEAPTALSIVTEAYNSAGLFEPTVSEITRATDYYLEEIKHNIARVKDWKILEATKVFIPTAYQQTVSIPSDFSKLIKATFYDGSTKGTMQSATATTIELASGAGKPSHIGRLIFITSGNAKGAMSRIIDINGDIATIEPAWSTIPTSGNYMIADTYRDLDYVEVDGISPLPAVGHVTTISQYNGNFYLSPIPDRSDYAIVFKYLLAIHQIDLNSPKYTEILTEWRTALVEGVKAKIYEEKDDARVLQAKADYTNALRMLMIQDGKKRAFKGQVYFQSIGGLPR